VIHSWLNRLLLPDTVGTGGDSHTRFPIGISFPAGSGLVAFGAATGVMPLDMPESVLVRFKGRCSPASRCATWCTPSRCTPSRPAC
jgi:aconitate hydratase 2/2-methylisocitrate dehydratase